MKTEVVIIGAGLTGLLLGYRLNQQGISFKIIESRNRIGGRIHTVLTTNETPVEMGATWLGSQHSALLHLLDELKIPVFKQCMSGITFFESQSTAPPQQLQLPDNQPTSYRIRGGTLSLTNTLAKDIEPQNILLNTKVTEINYETARGFNIQTSHKHIECQKVVSTLPPLLLVNSVRFSPSIPKDVIAIANQTHTWMRDSIKIALSYSHPFWRERKFSGTIFSNVGPVTELYDHSNYENNKYALKGFIMGDMHLENQEQRLSKILSQLKKMFGDDILAYTSYTETLWRNEPYTTFDPNHFIFPHQNNGHTIYQSALYDNNFYIGGTETSPQYGGYMEGAVRSAYFILSQLQS